MHLVAEEQQMAHRRSCFSLALSIVSAIGPSVHKAPAAAAFPPHQPQRWTVGRERGARRGAAGVVPGTVCKTVIASASTSKPGQRQASYQSETRSADDTFFSPHKNALFPHNQFSTHFFSMKMAELGENVLVSCTIDFDDIQL